MNPIFQYIDLNQVQRLSLRPATFRERAIAQLIDGIILGAVCSLIFLVASGGEVFSVWASPVFPQYVLEIDENYENTAASLWWGGYFFDVELPTGKALHLNYPAPLLWVLYLLYYVGFTAKKGQTPGKLLKRLVVLDTQRRALPLQQSLRRWLGTVAGTLPLGWGLWQAVLRPGHQTWHDRWTGSRVYYYDF